jgi:HK97 family phage portal protein
MKNFFSWMLPKKEASGSRTPISNEILSSSDPRIVEFLGGQSSPAGHAVTESSSMRVSAVYACVRLLSGAISSLPLPVYQRTADGRSRIDSPLWWLLNEQPTPRWSSASMWEYVVKCTLLKGDAFVEVNRNRAGVVSQLIPLHPDTVQVEEKAGRLRYYVQPTAGPAYGLDQDDMLHFPGFGFNGTRSLSVIQHAAYTSIGVALAADDMSARFFSNGGVPGFIFETEGKMDVQQQTLLRDSFATAIAGTRNAFKPFVTTQGVKLREISISPQDSQLLEARKFQVVDIARAFGVPAHMIGETEKTSSWGSGIEHMTLGFVKFTLQPHLTRFEQELNRKLFRRSTNFVEFNLDGLLRGDSKAEADYLRQAIGGSQGIGWMTINEARRIKNLPPIEGADTLYDPTRPAPPTTAEPAEDTAEDEVEDENEAEDEPDSAGDTEAEDSTD